jgi:hypothetical protein
MGEARRNRKKGNELTPLWAGFVRVLIEANRSTKMDEEPPGSVLYPPTRKLPRRG